MMDECQNPNCPYGHRIVTMAFRGRGFCCENCAKACEEVKTPAEEKEGAGT